MNIKLGIGIAFGLYFAALYMTWIEEIIIQNSVDNTKL